MAGRAGLLLKLLDEGLEVFGLHFFEVGQLVVVEGGKEGVELLLGRGVEERVLKKHERGRSKTRASFACTVNRRPCECVASPFVWDFTMEMHAD